MQETAHATASRRCAARAPACSVAFLHAFGRLHGSAASTTVAPAARNRCPNHAGDPASSTRTVCPANPANAAANPSRGSTDTSSPSQARVAGANLAASMNRVAPPLARISRKPSANGVYSTSPPLMFNSHAIEAGSVTTAASCFARRSPAPISARLVAESLPAKRSSCGTAGAQGGGGRSCHATSTGLRDTGTSVGPPS